MDFQAFSFEGLYFFAFRDIMEGNRCGFEQIAINDENKNPIVTI